MQHAGITGVILAGGRARRMGGMDKGLVDLAGKPLIEYIIERIAPQVGALMINANRHRDRYAAFGYPVLADSVGDYWGPLAGVLSAMRAVHTPYVLTVPCDTPLLPIDLVDRLVSARERDAAEASTAFDGTQIHPVVALLDRGLASALEDYLKGGGRRAGEWLRSRRLAVADFSERPDAFININTVQDCGEFEGRGG